MQRGKFIVLEGLEGAGKSTLCTVIAQELKQRGIGDVCLLREPGGTALAEQLRRLIKQGLSHEPLQDKAELLLLYAARVQLVEQVIKPALASSTWVISDRHDLSSQAYQGGGRGMDRQLLTSLRDLLLGDFRPDLTFYLDIPPEQGLQRARQRGTLDRIEQEALPFFQRTRQRYLELAQADDSIITIDASQSMAIVCQAVQEQLALWFNKEPDAVCPGTPG